MDIYVSMFRGVTGKKPTTVTLASVLGDISSGRYAEPITKLRKLYASDKPQYDREKKRLPGFTVSGTAISRTKPEQHSNLLQVDIDNLGDKLTEVRARLKNDPHVAFGFTSPSGCGLKLGVVIDGTRHAESYTVVEGYFLKTYNVRVDPRCRDRLRLCFVSHDTGLWTNAEANQLGIPDPHQPTHSSESCILNDCIATPLNNCVTESLHHSPQSITENIRARTEAMTVLTARHPNLINFYTDIVEARFQAPAGARNDFITQAVPFLYRAVAPPLVLVLVALFYDCNRPLFNDPREQHMKEANAMLKSVAKTYVESLSTAERDIYAVLPEHEKDAFRICRDLALLPEPERQPFTFFLSFNHLGDRLGIHPMEAQRLMRRLQIDGLIRLLNKGTRREAGVKAKAGTYQWLLQSPQQRPTL